SQVVKTTEELIQPILQESNLKLVDIEYVKEGKNWFLRVYIDKDGGVDIEDCGHVSEQLGEQLDKRDPIKDPYFLEVSSPGAERPLKRKQDFLNYLNQHIYVKLYEPIDGSKEYQGMLRNFVDDTVTMEYMDKTRKKQIEIPYQKIAKARLAVTL